MRTLEAKDFFVRQAVEQALLEGAPLSHAETKMLYFTETEDSESSPEPEEEQEQPESIEQYEARMRGLFGRAFKRLKKENPETVRQWAAALEEIRKGDHYLLVILDDLASQTRPPFDQLKLFIAGICVAALIFGAGLTFRHFGDPRSRTYAPLPVWIQRLIVATMIGAYLAFLSFPWLKTLWRRTPHSS